MQPDFQELNGMTSERLTLTQWPGRALALDRAFLAILVIFAGLFVLAPDQAARSLGFTFEALLHVAPFLLLSVAIAAYSKASGADNLIARAFQGRTAQMILFAAAMGALSPFCSCGVIPLIAALLFMGVPLAPVMAFWLASPLMDPSMFVLTARGRKDRRGIRDRARRGRCAVRASAARPVRRAAARGRR
jgi:uncharacterized membrane protein YraQ (UPF0718 family)